MNFKIHLSKPTAKILNIADKQLIDKAENKEPINYSILYKDGEFAALAQGDCFRAIMLLEELKVNLKSLPIPFWNNWRFTNSIIKTM